MNTHNTPLKHCPFCGSVARRTGGTVGGITIATCHCSNYNCMASFKSVDYSVWNTRPAAKIYNKTTIPVWQDGPYESGCYKEV